MQKSVRLAVVQFELKSTSTLEDFLGRCEFFVKSAANYQADFVAFPELFSTQLIPLSGATSTVEAAQFAATHSDHLVDVFKRLSVQHQVNIVGGSQFVQRGDRLLNISYLFHRDGKVDQQEKIHITPSERNTWNVEAGHLVNVFDTDCGRVAILICYDIEFPELSRIAASKGAQIIFVPFNTDQRPGYLRVRYCAHARAIENHVYVALSGCVGNLADAVDCEIHYAQSAILSPSDIPFAKNAVVAECEINQEQMIVQDVRLDLLTQNRESGAVQNWNDRRKDIYAIRYAEGDTSVDC